MGVGELFIVLSIAIALFSLSGLVSADEAGVFSDAISANEIEQDELPVIIALKEQPFKEIVEEQEQEVEEQLEILDAVIENAQEPGEEQRLKAAIEEKDEIRDEIKKDSYEQALIETQNDVQEIKETVESCGGEFRGGTPVMNSVFATVPKECLDELSKHQDVLAVFEDGRMPVMLDKSVCSTGAAAFYENNFNGSTFEVAVIDTGVDSTHPAFAGVNVTSQTFHDAASSDPDYNDNASSTDDYSGHGTHVAGTVASRDSTYKGIAYGQKTLVNAKACFYATDGFAYCYDSDNMKAIDWAVVTAGADVVSRSIGMCPNGASDCAMARYLDAIVDDLEVTVVNSAGNSGPSEGTVGAVAYNILSVAATNDGGTCSYSGDVSGDTIASFSSRGPAGDGRVKPDIAAPGTVIRAPNYNWENEDDFIDYGGTSMATPHVSGAIALLLDARGATDPKALRAILLVSANDQTFSDRNSFGWGVMNLNRTLANRNNVIIGSVAENGGTKYYKNNSVASGTRVALVWNRHVVYTGSNSPSTYYSLNDLDLFLYDESDGSLVASSESAVDNVEIVNTTENVAAIIKVKAYEPNFTHGSNVEDFALAANWSFTAVSGPSLAISFRNTTFEEDLAPYKFVVDVNNTGGLDVHDINVTLSLPTGLSLYNGTGNQSVSLLGVNGTQATTWFLNASAANYTVNVNATSISYGETITNLSTTTISVTSAVSPRFDMVAIKPLRPEAVQVYVKASEQVKARIDYGLTDAYGSSAENTSFFTTHNFTITGLNASTMYFLKVNVTDADGRTNTTTRNFTTGARHRMNFTANSTNTTTFASANTTLDVLTNATVVETALNITLSQNNPIESEFLASSANKFVTIEADNNLTSNLTYVIIKVHYTDAEIAGVDENDLRLYLWNATQWTVFDSPNGGVNETGNYVWANRTGFSTYAVGAKKDPSLSLTSSPSWSVTAGTETTVTCSGASEVTLTLYRNNVQVSNPDTQTLAAGSYEYVCNNTETTNYVAGSSSNTLSVAASSSSSSSPASSSGGGSSGGGGTTGKKTQPQPVPVIDDEEDVRQVVDSVQETTQPEEPAPPTDIGYKAFLLQLGQGLLSLVTLVGAVVFYHKKIRKRKSVE